MYHPKIRKFTKIFINNYYKELLNNDDEYYYDFIIKGLRLINSDFNKFQKLKNHKETNVKLLQTNCGTHFLFYEEKDINNENKPVTILFLGINKNNSLFLNIIDDYAYFENFSTVDEIINFAIDYCIKNNVKKIFMNNEKKLYCFRNLDT